MRKSDKVMGYVYFVVDSHRYVKIGVTERIEYRMYQLQTANSYPIYLAGVIVCPDTTWAYQLEKYLHHVFNEYRVRGEWFTLVSNIKSWLCAVFKLPSCTRKQLVESCDVRLKQYPIISMYKLLNLNIFCKEEFAQFTDCTVEWMCDFAKQYEEGKEEDKKIKDGMCAEVLEKMLDRR